MKALVEYQMQHRLKQHELAAFLGVNQGQLNHWLRGDRKPSFANLKMLSEKTGISYERLLETESKVSRRRRGIAP